jgi:predicted HTH domain antitoxin
MSKTLTIELPDDAFSALRTSPEEFAQELRLAAAIKWYEMERISQGKAAELAGLSRAAFVEALSRYGVSAVQVGPEELNGDLNQALGRSTSDNVEDA